MQPWSQPLLWKQAGFSTAFSTTINADQFINSPNNVRVVIPLVYMSTSGTKVRVTVHTSPSNGFIFTSFYIGHADQTVNQWNFDGSQVQVFFGGSAGITVLTNQQAVSDITNYTVVPTKPFIVAFHGTTTNIGVGPAPGGTTMFSYVHNVAADESSTSVVTGYSGSSNVMFVSKIEVQ